MLGLPRPIVELRITPDGSVIGHTDDHMQNFYLGDEADLRANLRRLGMAAGLDAEEWTAYLALACRKLGTQLEAPGHGESGI